MSVPRRKRREYRPTLDGSLEPRCLLSAGVVQKHAAKGEVHALDNSQPKPQLKPFVQYFVANGGRIARLQAPDGQQYNVQVTGGGTVRARPLPGGRVALTIAGTSLSSEVDIAPFGPLISKGSAHDFAEGQSKYANLLNIGSLTVKNGRISQILGFKTAILSGPLVVPGSNIVDRIALAAVVPGGSISVGGDIATLDIWGDATLDAGNAIQTGRDIDLLNVGGTLLLTGGGSVLIGRDLGTIPQAPKGTGTGSNVLQQFSSTSTTTTSGGETTITSVVQPLVSGFIQGNVVIEPGSFFVVQRFIDNQLRINGGLVGASRFAPLNSQVVALGGIIP